MEGIVINMKKLLTIEEYSRMSNEYAKVMYPCKNCGHKVVIPYHDDKQICSWCKHYVFKNQQEKGKRF